MCYELIK